MFTVKIRGIHGHEVVLGAHSVVLCHNNSEHGKDVIECYDESHNRIHAGPGSAEIIYGRVWVMNANGKTVADYNLGGWELAKAA
jgi:hypothetical protein